MAPPGANPFGRFETEFFRALNALIEPAVRAGCASPGLVPSGLVVIETTGAASGRPRRVPLLATVLDGCVFVSTVRGPRSAWVANVRAHPEVRYWLGGRERRGRAVLLAPGAASSEVDRLPPLARAVALGLLAPAAAVGWTFAVIAPEPSTKPTPVASETTTP
jgi:deazaflavin-dependent oxidoreductase (nitroreductase family)